MKRYKNRWSDVDVMEIPNGPWVKHADLADAVLPVLRDAIAVNEAKDRLLVAYRTGGRTPEKALDTLAKHNANPPHVRLAALIQTLEAP